MQETRITLVTPAMAEKLLQNNLNNRRIRQKVVDHYTAMMIAGEWPITHQGIAFSEDGRLLDGQHRLLAIQKSGCSVLLNVTVGVPDSSYPYFDCGTKRTMEDALREEKRHTETAAFMLRVTGNDWALKSSPAQVHEMLGRLRPWLIKLDDIGTKRSSMLFSSVGSRAAALARAILAKNEKASEYSFLLYRKFVTGETENLPPIAAALIKKVLTNTVFEDLKVVSGSQYQKGVFFKMIAVYDERNKHLKRIIGIPSEQQDQIRAELRLRIGIPQ